MLPTVDWNVDPVPWSFPRGAVVAVLGGFAAISFIYGLVKKEGDQIWSGVFFGVLAAIVANYMPESYGIRYYSLLFVFVFLGGHALLKWQIRRGGGSTEDANDFIIYGVLGVLVGARLGHVLFYDLDKALADPAWVLKIWTGGLASHGAVLGLITAMWLYCKRRGIPFLEGADRFAFSAALGATLVRLGNLLNSEVVGKKTDGTWGFRFPRFDDGVDPAPLRHPSQLYEVTLGLSVLAALYFIDRALGREKRFRGVLISSFFVLYFSGRFFIEFFKEFEGIFVTPNSPLRMGQILSLPGILIGLYGLYWSFQRKIPAGWPSAESADDADDVDERDDDDDQDDDDAEDSDSEDDDQDDDSAEKSNPERQVDPDVEGEFDAEGRLKRGKDV